MMKHLFLVCCIIFVFSQNPKKEDCPKEITDHVDSAPATMLWEQISQGNNQGVQSAIEATPCLIFTRAKDGRGPLFWAYEFKKYDLVRYLISKGAEENVRDIEGNFPKDLAPGNGGFDLKFTPSPGLFFFL